MDDKWRLGKPAAWNGTAWLLFSQNPVYGEFAAADGAVLHYSIAMARSGLASLLIAVCCSASCLTAAESTLCPNVLTRLAPWSKGAAESIQPVAKLPRVEVRVCDSGRLQVAAFRKDRNAPDLAFDVSRFSLSHAVVNKNVFVLVMPGPYDVVVAIEYRKGIPKVAYQTSTHGGISVHTGEDQLVLTVVESGPDIKLETKTLTFATSQDELNP